MKDKEIQAEIEQLKVQLNELKKSREENTEGSKKIPDNNVNPPVTDQDKHVTQQPAQGDDLMTQFQELINALDEDIRQTKPATLLAIFALGILLGRMLPR